MSTLLTELRERGCIHDCSNFESLESRLESQCITFYCGFDPTADSLHVGSMLPLTIMRRMQRAGHKPIVLLGSATGMIGDPSGRSEERKLLDNDTIDRNLAGIGPQIDKFLEHTGENGFAIVRNDQWLGNFTMLDFLRDVGKHFSVNMMLGKESVKARLENREQGISYTEFSYMLLQAYDFYHLYTEQGCELQVGGSDQWGNITAGIDLIRRRSTQGEHPPAARVPAFGLTFPLLMNTNGTKFGKSEQGTVWLDSGRTSPYRFYQFWLNTADADVLRYLALFTDIPRSELDALAESLRTEPEARAPQRTLAQTLTTLVHGAEETRRAEHAARVLFGESLIGIDKDTLLEIFAEVPSTMMHAERFASGMPLVSLLVETKLAESKGAARRLIEGGGVYLNNERVTEVSMQIGSQALVGKELLILRTGRKNYHLVLASSDLA